MVPRRRGAAWLGLVPFTAYVVMFLGIPTVVAAASGFFTADGAFTLQNFSALGNEVILKSFGNSVLISAITAAIGAVCGAAICYALLGTKPDGVLRTVVDSASSVLAQFGGVMLAFAFIATIGATGLITKALVQAGWAQNPLNDFGGNGILIYQSAGLMVVYLYFQVPLMVLTFLPAMEGLRPTWAEANATLGGTRWSFWWRIGAPVLAPSFLGSTILLFANSFSSYATAAALVVQGNVIVPLAIRQNLTSETIVGTSNVAGVLALGMVLVMAVMMTLYALLQRRADRWRVAR
ncbi:MAG: ABC transporter permease [Micrococcales bacterium]|nr:ABC transporter permease [Micrococcales bacterium]